MKITATLLLVLCLPNTLAHEDTGINLPEGAVARIGKGSINDIQYSPDGARLAVATSIGVWLYDTVIYREVALIAGHTDGINSVAFSPDGKMLVGGGTDGEVRVWDAETGELTGLLAEHTNRVTTVSFSPDGRTLASGWFHSRRSNGFLVFEVVNDGFSARPDLDWPSKVYSVALSPDGTTLATADRGRTVRLWDAVTNDHKRTLAGHTGAIWGLLFSPDGKTLASRSVDGTVLLWKVH